MEAPAAAPAQVASPAQPATANPPSPELAAKPKIELANDVAVKQLVAAAKGKVLVVNVWATFCIPCIEEMPELAKFYRERDADHVEFLSLNTDPVYTMEDAVKPFAREKDIPFPIHVWNDLPPEVLIDTLGVKDTGWDGELPATFIFDSTGALKRHWLERVHLHDVSAAVAEVSQGQ